MFDKAEASLVTVRDCRYGRMMYLSNDAYIGRALDKYGEYSESEVELWRRLVQPEWVVVNAGANIGAHTIALSKLVPTGTVVAFEPIPFLFYLLCGNIALNGATNVRAFPVAVGAAPGHVFIPGIDYTQRENYGGLALGKFDRGQRIQVVRLDDVLPTVDMIQADVEGMEGQVLQGADRLIRECRPVLYLENNPGPTQGDLIAQVKALGYDVWRDTTPLYNASNYRGDREDVYGVEHSFNVLCLPSERAVKVNGLEMV